MPLLLPVAALPACSALRVSEGSSAGKVPGLPFYRKTTILRQTTTYESLGTRVTLRIGPRPAGPDAAFTPDFVEDATIAVNDREIFTLLDAVEAARAMTPRDKAASDAARKTVVDAFTKLRARAIDPANPTSPPKAPVADTIERVSVVDTSKTYYLNSALPWFGKGSLTTELDKDGTLTKAVAETDSKLAEALVSFFPLKEFLTAELVPPAPEAKAATTGKAPAVVLLPAAEPATPWRFEVVREVVGYQFAFQEDHAIGIATNSPIAFDLTKGRFTRTPIGGKKESKEDDGKKISFSGDVKLPKGE